MKNIILVNENVNQIFIHIGVYKTGTTSIQETLFNNRELLLQVNDGYFYSDLMVNQSLMPFILFEDLSDFQLNFRHNISKRAFGKIKKDLQTKLVDQLKNTHAKNLIFCAESMTFLKSNSIQKIKDTFSVMFPNAQINIVIFTRDYIDLLGSQIQQNIKTCNIPYKIPSNFYRNLISRYEKYFFPHVIVNTFENSIKHLYGPVGFFLTLVGMNNNNISKFNIYQSNRSLSDNAIEIINYINEKNPIYESNKIRKIYLNLKPLWNLPGDKYTISSEALDSLISNNLNDSVWLKENYNIDYEIMNFTKINYDKFPNVYNENYYNEIIDNYKYLSFYIKKIVLLFFYDKRKEISSDDSEFLLKIIYFIESNYPLIKVVDFKIFIFIFRSIIFLKKVRVKFGKKTRLFYSI